MRGNDAPGLLLGLATRLLPADRSDWGHAMLAELEAIAPRRERWSFAAGCSATVAKQVGVWKSLGYSAVTAAIVVGGVLWSAGISYEPLRWRVIGLVVTLAAVITLGRFPGPLGPVAPNRSARLLRASGFVIVTVMTVVLLAHLRTHEDPVDAAQGVPILGSVLFGYLLGFVSATRDKTLTTSRTLPWGVISGTVAAWLWLAVVMATGHVPVATSMAFAAIVLAVVLAYWATTGDMVASLVAGTICTLWVVVELLVVASYAPATMIPDLAPAALTPADDLQQSRAELQDPYVFVFVVGAAIALALSVTSLSRHRPGFLRTPTRPTP